MDHFLHAQEVAEETPAVADHDEVVRVLLVELDEVLELRLGKRDRLLDEDVLADLQALLGVRDMELVYGADDDGVVFPDRR
jgi:hypothetical protein